MKTRDLLQGSPEWQAYRAGHFNASDAPAMMGVSPYKTRAALLREMHTGVAEPVDAGTQKRFDNGHRLEALARPLAEEIVGQDLYPVTGSEGRLSASFDGLTLDETIGFEHKHLNAELKALFAANGDTMDGSQLPAMHRVQMEQQIMVSGAERVLFMTSDWDHDGSLLEEHHCWYRSDPALRQRIVDGWAQFAAELAAYEPPPAAAPVVAAAVEQLPAVSVRMDGALAVRDNLPEFGQRLRTFVAQIPKAPSTDQEFADTEAACKALKRAEEALDAAEAGALASIATVEQMRATVGTLRNLARQTRLASEKLVSARKEQLREEIVAEAALALGRHIASLEHLHGGYLVMQTTSAKMEIGAAIRGLKTLDSIRGAAGAKAAALKIDATAAAERIAANRATLAAAGEGAQALFHDRAQLVLKDPEAVTAIVSQRLAEQRAAEERRAERIRAEERQRAEAAAQAAQAAQAAAAAAATAAPTPAPTSAPAAAPIAQPAPSSQATEAIRPVKLGDINARLGWTITAAEVKSLGVEIVRDGPRILIAGTDLPALRRAMLARIEAAFGGAAS